MNKAIIFAIFLFIGCDTTPPRPATIVIYDTLESQATRFRTQYNLPPEYEMTYEKGKAVYVVKYHFSDIDEPGFLTYDPIINFTNICWTRPYASEIKKPLDAVKAIKRHYADVLADRKKKPGKP